MIDYERSLYIDALNKWGFKAQKGMFIEEIGEVLTAINKVTRLNNGCTIEELIDEFIDMEILLNQMKIYYTDNNQFNELKNLKLKNLEVHLMDK